MTEVKIHKIDFQITYGQYEFLVISFSFTNGLEAFDLMNRVFSQYHDIFVIVFIDNLCSIQGVRMSM